jgi:hypothetical protein
LFIALVECRAADLYVGAATISIMPDRPVALAWHMHTRIARTVESPSPSDLTLRGDDEWPAILAV